jgi:hypothetical protein
MAQKINIDVDRNIYPSTNPDYEYQANAKKLSVYFNRIGGDLGICVCQNPDPEYWSDVTQRTNTWAFLDLPEGANITIDGNEIIYDYGEISIRFDVLLDQLRRTIIVESLTGANIVDQYLSYAAIMGSKIVPAYQDNKNLYLYADGSVEMKIVTYKMRDSAQIQYMRPCHNCGNDHVCGSVSIGDTVCSGDHSNCPRGREPEYRPAESASELVTLIDGRLTLTVDSDWLKSSDRVYPVYINDDITSAVQSYTGYGYFAIDTVNLFDGSNSTFAGGGCDHNIRPGTDYIDIELDGEYNIESFDIRTYDICETAQTSTVELLYDNSGYQSFSPVCQVSADLVDNTEYLSNNVSGQSISTTKVRIAANQPSGARWQINWIKLYGTSVSAGTTLNVNSLSNSQNLDQVTLTQKHTLSANNLSNANSLDQVTLTQKHALIVNSLNHIQSLDQVTLDQKYLLSVNSLSHLQSLDQVTLTQKHLLSLNNLSHVQSLDEVTLLVGTLDQVQLLTDALIVSDLNHAQTLDQVQLLTDALIVSDLSHVQSLDQVTLIQNFTLDINNLSHNNVLSTVSLVTPVVGVTGSEEYFLTSVDLESLTDWEYPVKDAFLFFQDTISKLSKDVIDLQQQIKDLSS